MGSIAYAIIITVIAIVFIVAFIIVFHKAGYDKKVFFKLGLSEQKKPSNYAIENWNDTLRKLDYDSDIVFFGDSITRKSDFRKNFPDKKIVNLGCSGDSIADMMERVQMIKAVSPKQVFLLCGINGLSDSNVSKCIISYDKLLNAIEKEVPSATIYIQSILPISKGNERKLCHNSTIEQFNLELKELANSHKIAFIDLYSLYVVNGELDPQSTEDGLHLLPDAYEKWANAISCYIE